MKIKLLPIILALTGFSICASAQSSAQIEAAKAMARAQGYSEAEINAMISKQQGGVQGQQKKSVATIDRNQTLQRGEMNMTTEETEKDFQYFLDEAGKAGSEPKDTFVFRIYGHELFRNTNLNFIPSYNIPTPESYKLAAGDEIVLDLWGSVYDNMTQTISPEGSITIPDLGPVYLIGQTVKQAEENLRIYLSKIYSGLGGSEPTTFLRVTLGMMRSLTVNVVGDVERPGSYTLPSLSNITSALYMAGGPTDLGTVRNIKVYRNNKLVKSFDIYKYLDGADFDSNIRLEDNDLIKVGAYENLVKVAGNIKRPMIYEMKESESVKKLLEYAGGFSGDANEERIHITRTKGLRSESYDVSAREFASFRLKDGDSLTISPNIKDNLNRVYIYGSIWNAGSYAISDTLSTLQKLIKVAGGPKDDIFTERGYIQRFNERRDTIALHFNVKDVMDGREEIMLMPDDSIRLFAFNELEKRTLVYSFGELNKPDTFVFRPGVTLGDIILLSGGFTVGAAKSNIAVARRNVNDGAMMANDTISTVYNFNLLENPDDVNFELAPYDVIFVRTAPNYKKQQTITVDGEVNFPGRYVVEKNVVRISDVITKAGGFNHDAYVRGATIKRKLTDEEYERAVLAREMALKQVGADSTRIERIDREGTYNIGIDLQAAVDNPGSYADIVLSSGDIINVPKMNNTVKISGAVLSKNVVSYNPSLQPKDYINMAGGYMKHAMKKNTYIIYMNGMVSKRGTSKYKVEPGCEIIVPMKDMENANRISAAEIMSIASSTASVAAMVVSMINALSTSKP